MNIGYAILFGFVVIQGVFGNGTTGIAVIHGGGGNASEWQCLANFGKEAIIPIWFADDGIDSTVLSNMKQALNAGFASVDLWAFVCPLCPMNANASIVAQQILDYTKKNRLTFNVLYFVLNYDEKWWPDNTTANLQYLIDAASSVQSSNYTAGFYAEATSWRNIVGDGWDAALANAKIWYSHEDRQQNFDDWSAEHIGQWPSPSIKDYDSTFACNQNILLNWHN